jgi:hypothetical protein
MFNSARNQSPPKILYALVTRVRNKIRDIKDDVVFLDRHYGTLSDGLYEIVCEKNRLSINNELNLNRVDRKRLTYLSNI